MENKKIIKNGLIYKFDFPNGKCYIGRYSKSEYNLIKRYKIKEINGKRPVNRAMKKYGFDNINLIIVENISNCSNKLLDDKEIYYIKYYKSLITENGYNINLGGEIHDNFTNNPNKEKIREKIKLRLQNKDNHPMKNKHHSDESKKIISGKAILRYVNKNNHPMKNKHHTNKSKLKISKELKGKYVGEKNKEFTLNININILNEMVYSKKTYLEIMKKYKISQRILTRFLLKYYGSRSLNLIRKKLMTYYKFSKSKFEKLVNENKSGRYICRELNTGRLTMLRFIKENYSMNTLEELKHSLIL